MNAHEIILKPLSPFGTPLKGDTLFGQFCWEIANDETILGKTIDEILRNYHANPFLIFSSAHLSLSSDEVRQYLLRTPSLPLHHMFIMPEDKKTRVKMRKEYKARKWMTLQLGTPLNSFYDQTFLSKEELAEKLGGNSPSLVRSQSHNRLNRLTGRTAEGVFAPFAMEQEVFLPGLEFVVFALIDTNTISVDKVIALLNRMGDTGFGKDASTGLGRFEVVRTTEIDLEKMGSHAPNACYTLGPCVPEKHTFRPMFYSPFTRFGKHGDVLAKSSNPFKNPVIMADEGAVFIPKNNEVFRKPYVGSAIRDLSKAKTTTIAQGYAPYIPVAIEVA
ncbi:MAG TPA: hypothetical protein DCZ04_00215 [Syntrophorhabdus aromaticivorans]|nr:hypothetical protein [Syntrophorhabdus aromaticivorans]